MKPFPSFHLVHPFFPTAIAVAVLGVFCGCEKKGAGGPPGGFATQVVAVKAVHESVSEQLRVVGTVLANENVDLKPDVDGRVVAIHFEEGQESKRANCSSN